ncbi:MAG: hypothetical protein KAR11_01075 [Phycisphaerae bacterium]|nr:hypothetical protein [Phycisphaerae bacterium]
MNEENSSPHESQQESQIPETVESRGTTDPKIRLFVPALMLIGFGAYSVMETQLMEKYQYAPLSEDMNAWFSWLFNFCGPFIFIPAGLFFLVLGIRFILRRLVADQEGIGYVGKAKIKWGDISQLDATRLKSKDIVVLNYEGGKLVLDRYKMTDFKNLLRLVESKVPQDKRIS